MVTRDENWPPGTPSWVDLAADDFDQAAAFYSALFGWDVARGPEDFGGYSVATKSGHSVAGVMPKMDPTQPTGWTTYLATDDIEATLTRVRDHGGQVVSDAMDVGGLGRMALFTDPDGAFVGLWQGAEHTGFQLVNEPGSVTWSEAYCTDYRRNRELYTAVFGYTYEDLDMEGTEYATISVDGQMVGGIGSIAGAMPEGTPAHWTVCFKVDDTDGTLRKVQELGGRVVTEASDSEYGRIAAATDAQGASFWVMADIAE